MTLAGPQVCSLIAGEPSAARDFWRGEVAAGGGGELTGGGGGEPTTGGGELAGGGGGGRGELGEEAPDTLDWLMLTWISLEGGDTKEFSTWLVVWSPVLLGEETGDSFFCDVESGELQNTKGLALA